jgi:AraC family transcriptional regulator of adaptative response/methylated-DNA-[protein]-cysteine methyltransferase
VSARTHRQIGAENDRRWQAVVRRDAGYTGQFVFGVRSTGIYCRPGCPSRRPRRDRVVFFRESAQAERAGFRACRRCQPQNGVAGSRQQELVERVCQVIEENLEEPVTLSRLSAAVGVSPHHLQRTFKRVLGVSPRQYADARRLAGLKSKLRGGQDVTGAMYDVGYGSSSRLYERAPGKLGMTPATYRRGGDGMEIGYAIVGSPLGRLLVARTERGICAVDVGESDRTLERKLRREFPRAAVREDRNGLRSSVRTLLRHLEGKEPRLKLPLDVQGTAFQCRVWEELLKIPYGRTKTYAEVARAVGKPKAARAVGSACGRNPAPLVIPCHRVVRGTGALGGYGLGIERKRTLLAQEKSLATETQRAQRRR